MNVFKKLASIATAFALMMTMLVPVFAAEPTGKITLHTGTHSLTGVTFHAYRMMDLTVNGDSYQYTINTDFTNFFKGLTPTITTDDDAYTYLKDNITKTGFTTSLNAYISNNSIASTKEETVDDANKVVTFDALPLGYYAIIPSGDNKLQPNYLSVYDVNAVAYLKGLEPDVTKTVDNKEWTTAQIGDEVVFTVASFVPNMTGKTDYRFILKDTVSEGLTLNKDTLNLSVKIDGTDVLETEYIVKVTDNQLTVTFENFEAHQSDAMKDIIFTYSATLNEKALTSNQATNEASISYGNDPTLNNTNIDKVTIYTHNLTVTKVDGVDKSLKLSGADFNLYRGTEVINGQEIKFVDLTNGEYRVANTTDTNTVTTLTTPSSGEIQIKGLAEGNYMLVETKAPIDYNILKDPQSILIEATMDADGVTLNMTPKSVEVINKKGTLLPETGGMGTMIFTIVGVVGLGAVVSTFFVKKKEHKK